MHKMLQTTNNNNKFEEYELANNIATTANEHKNIPNTKYQPHMNLKTLPMYHTPTPKFEHNNILTSGMDGLFPLVI